MMGKPCTDDGTKQAKKESNQIHIHVEIKNFINGIADKTREQETGRDTEQNENCIEKERGPSWRRGGVSGICRWGVGCLLVSCGGNGYFRRIKNLRWGMRRNWFDLLVRCS